MISLRFVLLVFSMVVSIVLTFSNASSFAFLWSIKSFVSVTVHSPPTHKRFMKGNPKKSSAHFSDIPIIILAKPCCVFVYS